MNPQLSICIPTYNRARYIGEALESIIAQATDEVEIVVSDNASSDNTREIVGEFQKRFPNLRYASQSQNVGFDRNVMRVAELARGDYCWFLGSDDRVEPGSLACILAALKAYPNLGGISLDYIEYDQEMTRPGTRYNATLGRFYQDTLFENADDCFDVLGYYFGYFSGQIVNRRIWAEIARSGAWQNYCNGFVHIYMNGSVLRQSGRWLFLFDPCVSKRVNDELLAKVGFYERLYFDIVRTDEVIRGFLAPGSRAFNAMMRQGISFHVTTQIAYGKQNKLLDPPTLLRLTWLCVQYYYRYPIFWLKAFPTLVMPTCLIAPARRLYRAALRRLIR